MWYFWGNSTDVVEVKTAERARLLAQVSIETAMDASGRDAYLKATASDIVANIEQGKWTASEVLEAYIQASVRAQEVTNCLTEIMFEDARDRARGLDAAFASTGKLRGPLHGVPFSLKDQYDYAGFDSSIGFTQWANKPAKRHAIVVSQIIAAGGVPFVKTNVPQTMLSFECNNPLWGRSLNPHGKAFTCGGSSGGEAALLAMDGSALGVGSDIGGSLRIPPAYCGVYSIKPTAGRVSSGGAQSPNPGFEGIKTSMGPIGRSVGDLELFCRAIFDAEDPTWEVVPVLYREVQLPRRLKFGYYTTDGFIKASPANKRAVLETVAALRGQGHECIEFSPPDAYRSMEIFVGLTSSDAYKKLTSHLGPDKMDASLMLTVYSARLPRFLSAILNWAIATFLKDTKFVAVSQAGGAKSFEEYSKWVEQRNLYTKEFADNVWYKYGFDGLIAPVQAMPQLPHGAVTTLSPLCVGTVLYNVLDIPVGVLPVTRVDAKADKLTGEWTKKGDGSAFIEDPLYRNKKPMYDAVAMEGMPVSVQIVGKRWEDEKVLEMMKVVDEALGERGFGPGTCR